MSTPDTQHELDTEVILGEIKNRLPALESGEPSIGDIETLTNKRSLAMKVINRPAAAREIFFNNLLESQGAFEGRMSVLDIGDTYRREGTPESFQAARAAFDSTKTFDVSSGPSFDLILIVHSSVAEALLVFARDNNSNPTKEGVDILNGAAQWASYILDLQSDEEIDAERRAYLGKLLELPLIRGILARAVQLYANYSLRMSDMDAYETAIGIEKTHGLTPSNPNELGNRLGTVAQHHFEQAQRAANVREALNWLSMCISASRMAQEKHSEAESPAGYTSAVLGKILEARALLAKFGHTQDYIDEERWIHALGQIESGMKKAGAIQPDILASNAIPMIEDLEKMGWITSAKLLRELLGLQS